SALIAAANDRSWRPFARIWFRASSAGGVPVIKDTVSSPTDPKGKVDILGIGVPPEVASAVALCEQRWQQLAPDLKGLTVVYISKFTNQGADISPLGYAPGAD